MEKIAPHLLCIGSAISNVWLFESPVDRKRFLIDTGHSIQRLPLIATLWQQGIRMPGDLAAILLTHRHGDHAGNAAWMRKQFGAPVFSHESDAKILRGEKAVIAPKKDHLPFYKDWLRGWEDTRPAYVDVDDVFSEGAWKWGFRIYSVPGHTDGSVMIYHEQTRTLFTGDSIVAGHPFRKKSKNPRIADPDFCDDPETAARNIRRFLKELPPIDILCPGHGPAIQEQAFVKLKKLLSDE